MEMLYAQWAYEKFVCVGLDSDYDKIPEAVKKPDIVSSQVSFNRAIVQATSHLVCAYKPNIAFYEAYGAAGLLALQETVSVIRDIAPKVPVILDAKRADIGNTNRGYVKMAFEYLGVDAITVHPYLGQEALQPFLDMKDKGIIVLCLTSNPGAGEFQDLWWPVSRNHSLTELTGKMTVSLFEQVADNVARNWNKNNNCCLVVGATYPNELQRVRRIIGNMPILIPGIGKQGGDVEKTVKAGMDSLKQGMIINSSRGIIFASKEDDFADVARCETEKLNTLINQCREEEKDE